MSKQPAIVTAFKNAIQQGPEVFHALMDELFSADDLDQETVKQVFEQYDRFIKHSLNLMQPENAKALYMCAYDKISRNEFKYCQEAGAALGNGLVIARYYYQKGDVENGDKLMLCQFMASAQDASEHGAAKKNLERRVKLYTRLNDMNKREDILSGFAQYNEMQAMKALHSRKL